MLGNSSIDRYINEDVSKIVSVDNRWFFLTFLAQIIARTDAATADTLTSVAASLGIEPPGGRAKDVEPKKYTSGERIEGVSQVVRATARIVNALEELRCADAYDIACRFTWNPTRYILLSGIYTCAIALGESQIAEDIEDFTKE